METGTTILVIWLAFWSAGFVLLLRLRHRIPPGEASGPVPLVSVIIPARNEEHNLPRLLSSLNCQTVKPLQVIVVDDGSTDRTAERARELGATVIPASPLPDGWRGKTWACHQGAQATTGDLLLFLDADTWFEAGGLARLLAAYPGGAFSAGPRHAVQQPYEELSLFFNVAMTAGTLPDRLFGQLLLVDRESYRHGGGHEAVRGRVLETFWLAGQFRAVGIRVRSVSGRGVCSFRMYPNGPRELTEGWTKGFASGAGRTSGGLLLVIVLWMIGLMLGPLGLLITGKWLPWSLAYLLCAGQVAWIGRLVGTFRWFTAALFPAPLIFFFVVFFRSVLRSGRKVTWKGREIRAD